MSKPAAVSARTRQLLGMDGQMTRRDFVNGALAVPGAPENSDTVPAKFSEKNAADDKLITTAYTFKLLTGEQRRAIFDALKDQPAGAAFNADVGTELPAGLGVALVPAGVGDATVVAATG